VRGDFAPGVVNVGQIQTTPGSFNIVPGQARLALEFRHGTEAQMEAMQAALLARAEDVAAQFGLTLNVEQGSPARCAPMDEGVMRVIEGAAEALGLSRQRMMSFAGHDAQSMSRITPAGMLFVPSVGGISHNPGEYTKEEDVVKGAEVLLGAVIGVVSEKW
jgi:N-carbamoyl-L-amino-acid hydrolase